MAKNSPIERMKLLDQALRHHSWLYHVKQEPELSNEEFDNLEREFRGLCDQYPALGHQFETHVSNPVPIEIPNAGPLNVIRFTEPMLSVRKVYSEEEVEAFRGKFPEGTEFIYEAKLEGIGLRLIYTKGLLTGMATGGAGLVGEEVVHAHPLFVKGVIPIQIDTMLDTVEIRGEAWIGIHDFETYNESLSEKKRDPRSAVSGWVRAHPEHLDQRILNTLQFSAHWSSEPFGATTYQGLKEKLREFKFDTPPEVSASYISKNMRSDLVPSNGIMVKLNSLALQQEVGVSNLHPRWSVAYMFPPAEGTPVLKDVEWSTSGYGRVIPKAIFTPVEIGGVLYSSVTLDNYGNFMELGLGAGDVVSISRTNRTTPVLSGILESGDAQPLEAPGECPSCSSILETRIGKTSAELVCNNVSACPAQLIHRTILMGDKFGLDIQGLGPVVVADLVHRGYLTKPADLFSLNTGALNLISTDLKERIDGARIQTLDRFIKALCFPDVGVVLSKRIADALASNVYFVADFSIGKDERIALLEHLFTNVRFLTEVKGISNGIAMAVVNTMANPTFHENFEALAREIELTLPPADTTGFKVSITGSFDQTHDELVGYFAERGIELSDKLTVDCKYLVISDRASKSKLLKATQYSIPTLDVNKYASIESLIKYIKEH